MKIVLACLGVAVLFVGGAGVYTYIRIVGENTQVSTQRNATSTPHDDHGFSSIVAPMFSPRTTEERVRMPDGTWGTLAHVMPLPVIPVAMLPTGFLGSWGTTTPQPRFEPDMTLDAPTFQLVTPVGDTPIAYAGSVVFVLKDDGVHAEYVMHSEITEDAVSFGAPQLVAGGVRYEDLYGVDRLYTLGDMGVLTTVANPRALHFVGNSTRYLSDTVHVYFLDAPSGVPWRSDAIKIRRVEGALPDTFDMAFGTSYLAADEHAFYLNGVPMEGITPITARLVSLQPTLIVQDAQAVYRFGSLHESANGMEQGFVETYDRSTLYTKRLDEVSSRYTKDTYFVRYAGKPIVGADVQSFVLLVGLLPITTADYSHISYDYARDRAHVYYQGREVMGADPGTFQPFDTDVNVQSYGKDMRHVYYHEQRIDDADPQSFVPLWTTPNEGCGTSHYAKDVRAVYFENVPVEGADPVTFEPLINGYGRDARGIYHGDAFQPEVPASFQPACGYGMTGDSTHG